MEVLFDTYGTHVVKSAYGGGVVLIELKTKQKFSNHLIHDFLNSFVQFLEDISLGNMGNLSMNQSETDSEPLEYSVQLISGDKSYHTNDHTKLPLHTAASLMKNWTTSLILSP